MILNLEEIRSRLFEEKRTVRDSKEEKLSFIDQLFRRSILKYIDKDKANRDPNSLTEANLVAYEVAVGVTKLLQADSLLEYALKSHATILGGEEPSKNLISEFIKTFFKDPFYFSSPRDVMFVLVSNCFNRADELMETALKKTKSQEVGQDLGVKFLKLARISESGSTTKNSARHNLVETLMCLKNLAELWGLDTTIWSSKIETIIAGQLEGMELIKDYKQANKAYSPSEALDYRKKTIGTYAELLGQIAFGNKQKSIDEFVHSMLFIQRDDDIDDIIEDEFVQPNPFFAILLETNLLAEFKKYHAIKKKRFRFIEKVFVKFFLSQPIEKRQVLKAKYNSIKYTDSD